jgi:hypothetical protein
MWHSDSGALASIAQSNHKSENCLCSRGNLQSYSSSHNHPLFPKQNCECVQHHWQHTYCTQAPRCTKFWRQQQLAYRVRRLGYSPLPLLPYACILCRHRSEKFVDTVNEVSADLTKDSEVPAWSALTSEQQFEHTHRSFSPQRSAASVRSASTARSVASASRSARVSDTWADIPIVDDDGDDDDDDPFATKISSHPLLSTRAHTKRVQSAHMVCFVCCLQT